MIERPVGAFAMRVSKGLFGVVRDSEMSKVERVAEKPKRHDGEFIQIGAALEEHQLETEFPAAGGLGVTRVIPPFRLRVFVSGQIAGKRNRIENGFIAKRFGLAAKEVGYAFERVGDCFFKPAEDLVKCTAHTSSYNNFEQHKSNLPCPGDPICEDRFLLRIILSGLKLAPLKSFKP